MNQKFIALVAAIVLIVAIVAVSASWYASETYQNGQRLECLRQHGSPLNTVSGWACVQVRQ